MAETNEVGPDLTTETIIPDRTRSHLEKIRRVVSSLLLRGAVPLTGLVLTLACNQAEKEAGIQITQPAPIEPPKAVQTMKALPTTNTPIVDSRDLTPSPTTPTTETTQPTPTSTPTQKPTSEASPTQTPTPPEQKKPESQWTIEVDPKLSHISTEILEADKAIIRSVIDKFPQIGNLKIVMTSGSVSKFDRETQTIILARNYERFVNAPESFSLNVAHELGHYLDVEYNGQALSAFLTEAQLGQLKQLREQALSDPVWGRNYPNLEKIFTRDKSKVSNALRLSETYTAEQLVAWSHLNADALWLGRYTPFRPYVYPQLKVIENYAQEATGISDVQSILDFLEKPDVAAKLEPLAAQNPLFAKALELIKTKKSLFTAENIVWPSLAPSPVHLQGKYTAAYWKALPIYIEMVMTKAYLEGNPDFMDIFRFGDDEDRERVNYSLEAKRWDADLELFPDLVVVSKMFGQETSLTLYLAMMDQFQKP